eukprot:1049697-Lingulodinium_polyedra.AAC.1
MPFGSKMPRQAPTFPPSSSASRPSGSSPSATASGMLPSCRAASETTVLARGVRVRYFLVGLVIGPRGPPSLHCLGPYISEREVPML